MPKFITNALRLYAGYADNICTTVTEKVESYHLRNFIALAYDYTALGESLRLFCSLGKNKGEKLDELKEEKVSDA